MTDGFLRARTVREVVDTLAAQHARGAPVTLLAGATDWMVERQLAHAKPPTGDGPPEGLIVDLTGIDALTRVERFMGLAGRPWLRLGAGVTYRTLRTHPDLVTTVPILGAMAVDVGAVQIQARGTLGGNLATASPAADGVPVLVALGAVVTLASVTGTREVPVEDWFTGYRRTVRRPDEVITDVAFPVPAEGARWFWRKVGTRRAQSIAKVALAAVAETEGMVLATVRCAMASVGPTVALLPRVRAVLTGGALGTVAGKGLTEALRADIAPIADVRSTREYRMHVAERLVHRMAEGFAQRS